MMITEAELQAARDYGRSLFMDTHWPADNQAWWVDGFRREAGRRKSTGWQIAYATIYSCGLEP